MPRHVTLQSRFPEIIAELRPKVSAAVKAGATLIADDAKTRVPVGAPTLHLRDEFHVTRLAPAEYEVSVGSSEAFYAHFVEFGTSHSSPRPFLIPAFEAQRDEVLNLMRGMLVDL